jgi:hypothetical protein
MTKSPVRSASIYQLSRKAGIDLQAVLHDLRTTSDRGAAIIGGGLVEWTTERIIIGRLAVRDDETIQRLSGRDGALQSFYSLHMQWARMTAIQKLSWKRFVGSEICSRIR